MANTKDHGCADPRDRLYVLLPFVHSRANIPAIMPDYTKSAWSLLLDILQYLRPSEISPALDALAVGISDQDLQVLVRQRVEFGSLSKLDHDGTGLSEAAKQLDVNAYQKRLILLLSSTPVA